MDSTRPGLVASAGSDGTCKLWDLRTGRPTCTLKGADAMPMHGCALYTVAGQPFAFTGGQDEAVKVSVSSEYQKSISTATAPTINNATTATAAMLLMKILRLFSGKRLCTLLCVLQGCA